MKLNRYLEIKKTGTLAFANIVGCSQSYISLLCSNKRRPSPELALKIEQATNGAVSFKELLCPENEADASAA